MIPEATPISHQIPLRVLFVDDEPRLLQGLQRMLHPLRDVWEMRFADGGQSALGMLQERPVDVVVSDMRMPGISGGQLLAQVMRTWPGTIRIILSGHADIDLVHRTIGPTHQFLQKPCAAETLKATVHRAWRLRCSLGTESLRRLVGSVDTLPSLPEIYHRLIDQLQDPNVSMERIGDTIASDLGMSARVLQLVNSAFFGCRRTIASPAEAVNLLGLDTINALTLTLQAFDRLAVPRQVWFDPDRLWSHSARVSRLAKRIAVALGLTPMQADEAALAGMLHDVGHLVLAARCPHEFALLSRRIRDEGDHLGERQILGSTHGEVGGYLLGLWGISDPIVEAVTLHHEPHRSRATTPGPLTCVHLADLLVHRTTAEEKAGVLDARHISEVGLEGRSSIWEALAADEEACHG
jgi:HD-like signal output (HDOD) protein